MGIRSHRSAPLLKRAPSRPGHRHMGWAARDERGPLMRASRWHLRPGTVLDDGHCHTFVEVFIVESGRGEHHVGGRCHPLATGDCWFLRPDDLHTLEASEHEALAWTNVSLPVWAERSLRARYGVELGSWPWDRSGEPQHRRIQASRLPPLLELAAGLPVEGGRRLDLDHFFTALLRALEPSGPTAIGDRVPAWLASAVDRLAADSDLLCEGWSALVREADRNPEYLNRCVRRAYGLTATELVRHLQIERAARRLRLSTTPIVDVAYACGFDNLSYFYRCFRSRFGQTPRRFRLMYQDPTDD